MSKFLYRQSDISTFLHCRRRFEWETVQRLEQVWGPKEARDAKTKDTGSLVHKGVEANATGLPHKEAIGELAVKLSGLDKPKANKTWKSSIEYAEVMVDKYIQWKEDTGKEVGLRALDMEHRLEVDVGDTLDGHQIFMTFKPDRILQDENYGFIVIDDIKTVDEITTIMDHNEQLMRYAVGYRIATGYSPGALQTTQLKRSKHTAAAKGPFFGQSRLLLTPDMFDTAYDTLLNVMREMVQLEQEIRAGDRRRVYQNRTTLCSWMCNVNELCDTRNRGGSEEHLIEFNYKVKEDPFE